MPMSPLDPAHPAEIAENVNIKDCEIICEPNVSQE
jgi:hypothetical protein